MPKRHLLTIGSALMLCVVAAGFLQAQTTTAEIQGAIHDPSGAVVPNAAISVKNIATGTVRSTKSNSAGMFNVPDLQPSQYELTVTASGFAVQRHTGIELTVGAQQVLNITLTTSNVSTTIEVSGAAPAVELANASLSGVEDARTTRELPLNGRDWTQLATLQPGVSSVRTQNTLNGSSSNRGSRGFGTQISINGGRPTQNNYFLDGISTNDYANATPGSVLGLTLGVDAIEEFSVITSNYNATYGQTSGGVVNGITRSGTNQFHGDAYEFLRNDTLDARNFFDTTKPPFRQNQFGVAAGGPIIKDRTFIFGNYEGLRRALTSTLVATVPSPNARLGRLAAGAVVVSPAVTPFLTLWPLPNAGLLGNGDTGVYNFAAKAPSSENFGSLKVDHRFSARDSLVVAYQIDDGKTQVPDSLNSTFVDSALRRQTGSVHETHIFSPTLLNVFRLGVNRVVASALNSSPGNNPAATDPKLGVLPGRDAPYLSVPGVNTYTGGLNGLATTNFWYTTYQLYNDLSIQRGRHSIKVGGEYVAYDSNMQVASVPNGEFDFNSFSDFLTNKPTIFYADLSYAPGQSSGIPVGTGFPKRGFRQKVGGVYFQDDFRLRDNLTINIGLRYEAANVPTEVHGRISNLRDIYGTNLYPGAQLFQNPTTRDFEPRIGLAWDPFRNGKTSIRAGAGIFDILPLIYQYGLLDSYSAPFSSLAQIGGLPAGSFPDGGYAFITSGKPVPLRAPTIEYTPKRSYVGQWNASIQRSVAPNLTLLVAYSGSRGIHMPAIANDADLVLPTKTALGYEWPTPVGSGTKINPAFGGVRQLTWGDNAFYHGLQTRVQRRFSHGFQMVGSFTWQKSIDGHSSTSFPTQYQNSVSTLFIDRKLNRGLSDFNIGRIFILNGLWELPKLGDAPMALRAITNGWQFGGIFQANDGLPFTPLISGDAAGQLSGGTYDVPNRVVGGACTSLTNPGNPAHYINTACYSFPNPRTLLGNAGRNSIIGPGTVELDASVSRNFPLHFLTESAQLQFRAEAFNLANRANFEPPVPNNKLFNATGVPIAASGLITSTATTSRQIQFALKLIW